VVPQLQNSFLYKVVFEIIRGLHLQDNFVTVIGEVPESKVKTYSFNLHKTVISQLYDTFSGNIEIFGNTYPENCFSRVDSLSFSNESWIEEFIEVGMRAALSGLATNKSLPANLGYLKAYAGRELHAQVQKFFQVGELAWRHLKNPVDLVIFPNGRFASQAPWRFFSDRFHREFLSYEHGEPKNIRFHLQKFQPQEISRLGDWLTSNEKVPIYNQIVDCQTAIDWIRKQRTSSNKFFLSTNTSKGKVHLRSERKTIVFFSSSADERLSNLSTDSSIVSNQIEWIKFLSGLSDQLRFDFSVRLHPNACNKSWLDLALLYREIKRLKGIKIYLPWSRVDTYSILDAAKVVISYGSTVSLEAAYQGIKSATITETKFSKLSKIPIISYENCKSFLLQDSQPMSKSLLEEAIFHRFNYGYELAHDIEFEITSPKTSQSIETIRYLYDFLQKAIRLLKAVFRVLTLSIRNMNELNYILPKCSRNSEFIFDLYFNLLLVFKAKRVRRLRRLTIYV